MTKAATGNTPSGLDGTQGKPRLAIGELLFAIGITVVGIIAVFEARTIPIPPSDVGIGPRAVPYVVGGLLTIVGALLVLQVLTGHLGEADEGEDVDADAETAWGTIALIVGALTAHVFAIVPLGWPIAATILFAAVAWILGARPWWKPILIGLIVALILQIAFARGLGLSLPPGPFLQGVAIFGG